MKKLFESFRNYKEEVHEDETPEFLLSKIDKMIDNFDDKSKYIIVNLSKEDSPKSKYRFWATGHINILKKIAPQNKWKVKFDDFSAREIDEIAKRELDKNGIYPSEVVAERYKDGNMMIYVSFYPNGYSLEDLTSFLEDMNGFDKRYPNVLRDIRKSFEEKGWIEKDSSHLRLVESFRKFVSESVTSVVYHLTTDTKLENILKENKFMTSIVLDSEISINKGKFYYFSTARSPNSRYFKITGDGACILVLDGDRFNYKFKGVAVDYWGPKWPDSDEMEDRVITDRPFIDNAIEYMKEVHIKFNLDEEWSDISNFVETLQNIEKMLSNKVPLFIYGNENSWKKLNKSKAVKTVEDFINLAKSSGRKIKKVEKSDWKPSLRFVEDLEAYSILFNAIDKKDKSNLDTKSVERLIRYFKYYPQDAVTHLGNDIHNERTKPEAREAIHRIFTIMRKKKFKDIKELVDYYSKKLSELDW